MLWHMGFKLACAGGTEHVWHRPGRPFRAVPGMHEATSESMEQASSPASSRDMMAIFTCTKCGERTSWVVRQAAMAKSIAGCHAT